jgi:hypothetical protein
VFGNSSYAAQLSDYGDQIAAIVPEPSTALLALVAGAAWILFRRRR